MAGWRKVEIMDIVEPLTTIDPRKHSDDEFEYIDVSSVSRSTFSIQTTTTILGRDAPSRARRLVRAGDVLFATIRPSLQRIAIVPDQLDGAVCSTGYFVLRPIPDVNSRFLFHYLFSQQYYDEMASLQRGASYPAVSDRDVKEHTMFLPPLPEQEQIVTVLDEAFAVIATATTNAEKNLANALQLFESELNSVFNRRGDGWAETTLGHLYEITSSKRVFRSEWKRVGVPFYRAREIVKLSQHGKVENELYISQEMYDQYSEKYGIPKEGDIMVTGVGTLGVCYVVQKNDQFYFKDGNIIWLKNRGDANSKFVEYAFRTVLLRKQIDDSAGATVGTYPITKANCTRIPLPPLPQQQAIVEKLDVLSEKTTKLNAIYQRKINAFAELKQTLLHKAFSGELTANANVADRTLSEAGL